MATYTQSQTITNLSVMGIDPLTATRITNGLAQFGAGPYTQSQITQVLQEQGVTLDTQQIARLFP